MTAQLKKGNLSSLILCNHFSDGLDVDQSEGGWRGQAWRDLPPSHLSEVPLRRHSPNGGSTHS